VPVRWLCATACRSADLRPRERPGLTTGPPSARIPFPPRSSPRLPPPPHPVLTSRSPHEQPRPRPRPPLAPRARRRRRRGPRARPEPHARPRRPRPDRRRHPRRPPDQRNLRRWRQLRRHRAERLRRTGQHLRRRHRHRRLEPPVRLADRHVQQHPHAVRHRPRRRHLPHRPRRRQRQRRAPACRGPRGRDQRLRQRRRVRPLRRRGGAHLPGKHLRRGSRRGGPGGRGRGGDLLRRRRGARDRRTHAPPPPSRAAAPGAPSTDSAGRAPTPAPSGAEPGDGGADGAGGGGDDEQPPADAAEATIADIQGTGAESPLAGDAVTTEGVVTAVYATGGLNGYVIQTAGTGGALDLGRHTGSTALFVHSPDTAGQVAIGDSVRVTGEVSEYYGATQVSVGADGLELLEEPLGTVEPLTLESGFPTEEAQRESLEHMLYLPGAGDFTVTDVYDTATHGEITLAIGDQPLQQAGDIMRPGDEATAYFESRDELMVLLDDGRSTDFRKQPTEPMSWLTTEEPVRVGAAADFTEPVVVAYSFDRWRLNTTTPWESASTDGVDFENTREDAPDEVGGDVRLSTFNVLNYFTTLGEDTPGCEPYTDMRGEGTTVRGGCDLRGAW